MQWHVADMQHDINLVLDNAMKYNGPESPFHRVAKRIKTQSKEILDPLDGLMIGADGTSDDVGDLEPAAYLLEALTSQVSDGIDRDRLADLFAFELEKPKEPTPPPPTPPPKKSAKRETGAERKRKWEEREAQHQDRLAGRATRAGQARSDAFKYEAGLPPSSDVELEQPIAAPVTGRRTRKSLAAATESVPEPETNSLRPPEREDRASASSGLSRSRSQVGVARTEPIERLTDKERRERERHLALITEEVGNSDLFTRFNVGWMLPEGSKRRRGGEKPSTAAGSAPKPSESSMSRLVCKWRLTNQKPLDVRKPDHPKRLRSLKSLQIPKCRPLNPKLVHRDVHASLSLLTAPSLPSTRRAVPRLRPKQRYLHQYPIVEASVEVRYHRQVRSNTLLHLSHKRNLRARPDLA